MNIENNERSFADWLKELIGNRSLNQVARNAGLTGAALSNYISGGRLPEPDAARKLASGLNISYEEMSRRLERERTDPVRLGELHMKPSLSEDEWSVILQCLEEVRAKRKHRKRSY